MLSSSLRTLSRLLQHVSLSVVCSTHSDMPRHAGLWAARVPRKLSRVFAFLIACFLLGPASCPPCIGVLSVSVSSASAGLARFMAYETFSWYRKKRHSSISQVSSSSVSLNAAFAPSVLVSAPTRSASVHVAEAAQSGYLSGTHIERLTRRSTVVSERNKVVLPSLGYRNILRNPQPKNVDLTSQLAGRLSTEFSAGVPWPISGRSGAAFCCDSPTSTWIPRQHVRAR